MDASRWKRVRELFEEALARDGAEREAWLQSACGDDAELLAEVRTLIAADGTDADTAAIARTPRLVEEFIAQAKVEEAQALTGRRFGPYSVTGELGRGGMGAVYLAERVDGQYRSEVAIKLIRASWGADELVARFAAERRILASLDHPNIARLLDAGVDDGQQPYLVLEYVRGRHIGVHCDRERLGIAPRLALFLSVCAAVSHAHERLVVHRDLKPSNILVGNDGQVKLLDFGVAKLIGGDLTQNAQTAADERIFTPEYAAPEQVLGESITTAVDVYALGLLLYELLTGARAQGANDNSRAAVERAVLGEEPLRPSAAVTRLAPERGQEVADARDLGLPRLRSALRGDLDAIVMKALRKKPADRYASVRDLADDVRRHLEQRPVAARQGDRRYRMLRFAQRHQLALGFGSAALLSLIAGLGVSLWQAHEARLQRDLARAESEKSRHALAFIGGVFAIADPGEARGAQVTARELLERGAERIRTELKGQPEARAELLGVLGRSYFGLGLYPKAVELGTEAVALRRQSGEPLALGDALLDLARAKKENGRADDAIPLLTEAEALLASAEEGDLRAGAAAALLGGALQQQGKLAEADAALERAQSRLRAAGGERSVTFIEALAKHTDIKVLRDDFAAADRLSMEDLALATAILDENDPKRLVALKARATALQNLGRDVEAETFRREILTVSEHIFGREHAETVSAMNNLATALYSQKRYAEVAPLFEQVVEMRRHTLDPDHPTLATAINNLASLKVTMQQPAEAEPLFREALAIRRKRFGNEHYNVGTTLLGLGMAENALGRPVEAAADLTESLRVMRIAAPDSRDLAAGPLSELAQTALDVPGRDPDCALAREAVTLRDQLDSKNIDPGSRRAMARAVLGVCLIEHGQAEEGRALVDASIDQARAGVGADSIRIRLLERHLTRR